MKYLTFFKSIFIFYYFISYNCINANSNIKVKSNFRGLQYLNVTSSINRNLKVINSNLCLYNANTKYNNLKSQYPEFNKEFSILSKVPLPIWYTDRDPNALNNVIDNINNCNDLLNIFIIYGLPNKDCEAQFSSSGSNKNENDYFNFINNLNSAVNNKEVVYILEPDAINFIMPNKCGNQYNYKNNLKMAIDVLSKNNNAKIYIDIGYWNLIYSDEQIYNIINILNEINTNNRLNGISLNLSNYRSSKEMIDACNRIRSLSNKNFHCIIDTSRNNNGPSNDNQWCNMINAGIGELPTTNTNIDYIDAYFWLKPAGELDGTCIGFSNSYVSNKNAGDFDIDYFKILWNNGVFNKKYLSCSALN
jgi:cellulase/cellobiase CelA1